MPHFADFPALHGPLFFVYFVPLWLFVGFVLSRRGWHSLAQRYPAERERPERRIDFVSGKIGPTDYNRAVGLGLDDQGIHFSVVFLFRFGHRPFFVPWTDMHATIEPRLLFGKAVVLHFAKVPGVTFRIAPALANRIANASQGKLVVPEAA